MNQQNTEAVGLFRLDQKRGGIGNCGFAILEVPVLPLAAAFLLDRQRQLFILEAPGGQLKGEICGYVRSAVSKASRTLLNGAASLW
nr:hypothetical protein [Methylomarinum sp. Ch1-1]MDP4520614.1 hypothetical protein [Methylomarinum sp. Ch1-1]